MFKYFFPQDEDFFSLFQNAAEELVQASLQFNTLLGDLKNREVYAKQIFVHEKRADKIEELTLGKLHKTFITPFDRYDIHRLINKLDDAVDLIKRSTQRIVAYQVEELPVDFITLGDLCQRATQTLFKAVGFLHNLKNAKEILSLCEAIKPLEGRSVQLVLEGVTKLFKEENDIKRIIQIKEIYEDAKNVISSCRIVAVIIKDIVLEYS